MKLLFLIVFLLLVIFGAYGFAIYKMVKTGKIRAKGAKRRRALIYTLIGINKLFPKKKKKKLNLKTQLA